MESNKNKIYYDTFKNKNKDKIKEKQTCAICGGSYSYFTKSNHIKTTKHKYKVLEQTLKAQEALKNV